MLCDCGSKKNHSVHIKALARPGYHPYRDPSKVGMGESDGRREYRLSQTHKDAYEVFRNATGCLPHDSGAPGECRGDLSPHHVVPRSVSGALPIADAWPVIATCTGFNSDVESEPDVRTWAERHTFVWLQDGNEYFFRYNQRMYRAALAQLGARA